MSNIGWPLDSNAIRRGLVNNTFGLVRNGGTKNHQGWDFYAEPGTPCFAIADGTIAMIYESEAYGLVIVCSFQHDGRTIYAAYAHLSQASVAQGQVVKKGQRIGLTGNSGNAESMRGLDQHLHFEIRTIPRPGKGLEGRMSPKEVFGHCPLKTAVRRVG
jgi:murein DD-endopeptidase MepM/ murein hydrolase activator NlpD